MTSEVVSVVSVVVGGQSLPRCRVVVAEVVSSVVVPSVLVAVVVASVLVPPGVDPSVVVSGIAESVVVTTLESVDPVLVESDPATSLDPVPPPVSPPVEPISPPVAPAVVLVGVVLVVLVGVVLVGVVLVGGVLVGVAGAVLSARAGTAATAAPSDAFFLVVARWTALLVVVPAGDL